MFIALEGVDGSGKTTQVARLLQRGLGHVLVPGCSDSPIGKLVRRGLSDTEPLNPLEMQAAYTADRFAREHEMRRFMREGFPLVADRWTMSALVYGALHLDDPDHPAAVYQHRDWLAGINKPVLVPDLYVVLLARAPVILERLAKRKGDREIYEREDTIHRVVVGYRDVVVRNKTFGWLASPIHVVDTDDLDEDAVEDQVLMAWKGLESGGFKPR